MLDLAGVGAAAVDGGGTDAQSFSEAEDFVADLGGELAGGDDNEGFDGAVALQAMKDWQAESGGFSRTGMGLGDEVAPLEDEGDRLLLDRAGFAEARGADRLG